MSDFGQREFKISLTNTKGATRTLTQKIFVTGTERYYKPCAVSVYASWILNRCTPVEQFADIVYTDRYGNVTVKFN